MRLCSSSAKRVPKRKTSCFPSRRACAASPQSLSDFTDLSEDLLPGHSHFSSAEDLREFLSRPFIETTKGRVFPRRASVLAYITNQLPHSHCVVQKEEKEPDNQSQPILFDLPRPKRD